MEKKQMLVFGWFVHSYSISLRRYNDFDLQKQLLLLAFDCLVHKLALAFTVHL